MGYTNYHYQKENFNDHEWKYIQDHKKKIMQHLNYIEIEEDKSYKENGAFRFCKTNRKPYDKIVWNILLKAYEIAPHKITIQNDDGKNYEYNIN